ncbi:MAG: hypothetical protein P9L94_10035 [Candidatus Hinthialibacter antarcticus]|nr:hypothetical protein [Candidatus Hinthialibacter antarcticus]
MRLRCLIIDTDLDFIARIRTLLDAVPSLGIETVNNVHDTAQSINSQSPNLVIARRDLLGEEFGRVIHALSRINIRCYVIIVVQSATAEQLKAAAQSKVIQDIITHDVDDKRLSSALNKGVDVILGQNRPGKHYRGFMGFVGITPSLRERKILTEVNMGILHNRSARLAIDYWRNHPSSQMISVALNVNESLSSRSEEQIENWENHDLKPWEIALYEAQNHYVEYWQEPIRGGLLPSIIPSVLQYDNGSIAPMDSQKQANILVKINRMTQRGELHEILKSMGIAFHVESTEAEKKDFEQYISRLKDRIDVVDKKHPNLMRPPEELEREKFTPDKAAPISDDSRRMAFVQKTGGRR